MPTASCRSAPSQPSRQAAGRPTRVHASAKAAATVHTARARTHARTRHVRHARRRCRGGIARGFGQACVRVCVRLFARPARGLARACVRVSARTLERRETRLRRVEVPQERCARAHGLTDIRTVTRTRTRRDAQTNRQTTCHRMCYAQFPPPPPPAAAAAAPAPPRPHLRTRSKTRAIQARRRRIPRPRSHCACHARTHTIVSARALRNPHTTEHVDHWSPTHGTHAHATHIHPARYAENPNSGTIARARTHARTQHARTREHTSATIRRQPTQHVLTEFHASTHTRSREPAAATPRNRSRGAQVQHRGGGGGGVRGGTTDLQRVRVWECVRGRREPRRYLRDGRERRAHNDALAVLLKVLRGTGRRAWATERPRDTHAGAHARANAARTTIHTPARPQARAAAQAHHPRGRAPLTFRKASTSAGTS
jgi:hypothetical protein